MGVPGRRPASVPPEDAGRQHTCTVPLAFGTCPPSPGPDVFICQSEGRINPKMQWAAQGPRQAHRDIGLANVNAKK